MAKFTEIFEDVTKKGVKIPSNLYLDTGLYPIIDQGQSAIAGYTNKADGLFFDVPAIIFGDHTRIFKYVEKPCFLGADGVKLLKAKKPNANHKYLYYALCNADIPNTGYNRHFKWLKEVDIPEYSVEEQEDIVLKLDKISHLIALRKRQLSKLDELVKSRFVEMFGDKGFPTRSWDRVFDVTTGKLDSNAATEDGVYPFFTCAKSPLHIDYYAFDCEALLLAGNNAAGIYDVKYYKGKFNAYQRTYVLRLKDSNWQYVVFKTQLESKLAMLQSASKGTMTKYLTMGILKALQFVVPDNSLQREFAAFVEKVDKLEFKAKASLEKLETLKKAMMQKYFG